MLSLGPQNRIGVSKCSRTEKRSHGIIAIQKERKLLKQAATTPLGEASSLVGKDRVAMATIIPEKILKGEPYC